MKKIERQLIVRVAIVAALTTFLVSCPNPISDQIIEDVLVERAGGRPEIVSISPSNGQAIVADSSFSITFNMEMDRSSVETAITLLDSANREVASGTSWDATSTVYAIDPNERLTAGATYTLRIEREARNQGGAPLEQATSAEYQTITVDPDQLRFDLTYDGEELSNAAPLYLRFSWSDTDSTTIGPYTEDGTIIIDNSDLGGASVNRYLVEFIHDRNNSYQSGNGSDGDNLSIGNIDFVSYLLPGATNGVTTFRGYLHESTETDLSQYVTDEVFATPAYTFETIRSDAFASVGQAYSLTISDMPDHRAGSSYLTSLPSLPAIGEMPITINQRERQFFKFIPPVTEYYTFSFDRPSGGLAFDAYLWGVDENSSGGVDWTVLSDNTAYIPFDADRAINWSELGNAGQVAERLLEPTTIEFQARLLENAVYILEVRNLDDPAVTSRRNTQGTVDLSVEPYVFAAASDTIAEVTVPSSGTGNVVESRIETFHSGNMVDRIRLNGEATGRTITISAWDPAENNRRTREDTVVTNSSVTNAPGYARSITFPSDVSARRQSMWRITVEEYQSDTQQPGDGTQVGDALTWDTLNPTVDTSDSRTLPVTEIYALSGSTDYWVFIENETPTISELGTRLTTAYWIEVYLE